MFFENGSTVHNCPFHFQDVEERFVVDCVSNPFPSEAFSRFQNKPCDWKIVSEYRLVVFQIIENNSESEYNSFYSLFSIDY
jgi:hypothetical protein